MVVLFFFYIFLKNFLNLKTLKIEELNSTKHIHHKTLSRINFSFKFSNNFFLTQKIFIEIFKNI